jgi:hypothetical protein
MCVPEFSLPVVRLFHSDPVLPTRAPLQGLHEICFSSLAGRQSERPTHALVQSAATLQFLEASSDDGRPVLNGVSFSVSAFLERSQTYVTAEGFSKQIRELDNVTAGVLAQSRFWRELSICDASHTMHQIWQQSLVELAQNALALHAKVVMEDVASIEGYMKRELEMLLASWSESLMGRTTKEITSRLADRSL